VCSVYELGDRGALKHAHIGCCSLGGKCQCDCCVDDAWLQYTNLVISWEQYLNINSSAVNITSIASKPESQAATATTTTTTRQQQLHQKRQHSNCKRYRHKYPFSNTGRHILLVLHDFKCTTSPWAMTAICVYFYLHTSTGTSNLTAQLHLHSPLQHPLPRHPNHLRYHHPRQYQYRQYLYHNLILFLFLFLFLIFLTVKPIPTARLYHSAPHHYWSSDISSPAYRTQHRHHVDSGSLFTYLFTRWIYLSIHASVIDLFIHNSFYLESTIYIVHMYVYTVVVAICIPVALLCLHPRYFRAADPLPSVTVTHQRCQSPNFPQKVMENLVSQKLCCNIILPIENIKTSFLYFVWSPPQQISLHSIWNPIWYIFCAMLPDILSHIYADILPGPKKYFVCDFSWSNFL